MALPAPLQVIGRALRDWWDDWINMTVITLLWWLCWLTIVLGPPATLGIYHVTNLLAHGDSQGPAGFIDGIKRYFWRGWAWFLLNVVAVVLIIVNFFFYRQFEATWATVARAFFLVLGLLWALTQFYALPYLIEQEEKSLRLALRNGLFTALAAPGYTLVVAGFTAAVGALGIVLVVPLFLGGVCLVASLGNRAMLERVEVFQVREREAGHLDDDADLPGDSL